MKSALKWMGGFLLFLVGIATMQCHAVEKNSVDSILLAKANQVLTALHERDMGRLGMGHLN